MNFDGQFDFKVDVYPGHDDVCHPDGDGAVVGGGELGQEMERDTNRAPYNIERTRRPLKASRRPPSSCWARNSETCRHFNEIVSRLGAVSCRQEVNPHFTWIQQILSVPQRDNQGEENHPILKNNFHYCLA
jgi:hypothetical protein